MYRYDNFLGILLASLFPLVFAGVAQPGQTPKGEPQRRTHNFNGGRSGSRAFENSDDRSRLPPPAFLNVSLFTMVLVSRLVATPRLKGCRIHACYGSVLFWSEN